MEHDYPSFDDRMEFLQEDANTALPDILKHHNWRHTRGVVFIDPYGANVDFETLKKLAEVPSLDIWLLFPLGQAINRLLTNDPEKMPRAWAQRLDRVFGTDDWRKRFYRKHKQPALFEEEERETKVSDWNMITEFYQEQLQHIFPKVSRETKMLRNKVNNPLFAFIFATTNPSGKAQGAALRIANHLLKNE